ncbi:hypothetical protein Ahy_B03g062581 [Arachis hypogaea]|uniref:Exportin-5 C-terminal domain-containing protein n=1 Tax=Arachis hypogaea TaxID=3818 RepID=A0A444ZUR7_ARAHY|nr:hypothetical protein Ahy_B03g062581 [Arachis hypogaea]
MVSLGASNLQSIVGDSSILPFYLEQGIANTIGCLQREGCLLRGEHNLLGEAFLVMASVAGQSRYQLTFSCYSLIAQDSTAARSFSMVIGTFEPRVDTFGMAG